jgi:hypothetical protein
LNLMGGRLPSGPGRAVAVSNPVDGFVPASEPDRVIIKYMDRTSVGKRLER